MEYGKNEFLIIDKEDIDKLVFLPQVRKVKNSRTDEIANSIKELGLLNNPNVTLLNYDELKSHIDFLNRLWGKNVNIDSFPMMGDHYVVVIAGHTRLNALKQIPKSDDPVDHVYLRLHNAKTSEEILAIQLSENIHEKINPEDRAAAIIGTYQLGLESGKWHNKTEFIAKSKDKYKFGDDVLYEAMFFANLSLEAQDYIFSGHIPYTVGVALGKMYPLIEKFMMATKGFDMSLEEGIKSHYCTLLTKVKKAKSVKQAFSILEGDIFDMDMYFKPKEVQQQIMFDYVYDSPRRQGEELKRFRIKEYNKAKHALMSLPFDNLIEFLSKNTNLTGIDHSDEINSVVALKSQYYKRRLQDE